MRRSLLHSTPHVRGDVRGAVLRFAGDPGEWLPGPARRRGADTWTVTLAAGAVHRSVAVDVGALWWVGEGQLWRAVTWRPAPSAADPLPVAALLPSFRGELGLRVGAQAVTLELAGFYDPPGGRVGAAADRAAGHRVASSTARRFCDTVLANLVLDAPAVARDGSQRSG